MPLVHCHTACRLLAGLALAATLGLAAGAGEAAAQSQSRIKDVADFEGVRDNLLVGYGLVVGLNGTGDDLDSAVFTRESLRSEEHTSELQSLMRISYAVFCLKKKTKVIPKRST